MTTRPKTVAALIRRVLSADPNADSVLYERRRGTLTVKLNSAVVRADLLDEIDLPVVLQETLSVGGVGFQIETQFLIVWDCSDLRGAGLVQGYQFDGRDDQRRARRAVTAQEEDGASLIGGERHVGSGALLGLKSDASSGTWQQEAKQTAAKSIRVTLEWLEKISREARVQDKQPMLFVRFTDVPEEMAVENDWVLISAAAFRRMEGDHDEA